MNRSRNLFSSLPASETGQNDVNLMLALKSGETDALASLYDRYGRIVYSLAAKILSDQRESEEVTQDVFLALWNNPGVYRADRSSPLTWLASITRNKCIDRMRRAGRRIPALFEGADERTPVQDEFAPDPFQSLEKSDLSGLVRDCLDRLPDPQRCAVESAYFQCLTIDEISEEQEIPSGTIKSRIRLAMDKLRRCLRHKSEA